MRSDVELNDANRLSEPVLRAVFFAVLRRGETHRASSLARRVDNGQLSLDESAGRELNRARRYERPLTVISITLRSGAGEVARVSAELRQSLRMSDIVGLSGHSALIAVLPETTGTGASEFLRRLANAVDEPLCQVTDAGIATFPQDNVTWLGLQAAAHDNREPLAAYRGERAVEPAQLVPASSQLPDRTAS